jgi:class 3 adenylate cyclase/tetratricopeptide (TPR) repeat protein
MSATFEQVSAAVAALEAQRMLLGDLVVETALAPLRRQLSELRAHDAHKTQQLKQVSVVFVDVVGSTAIGQQLGPEEIHALMDGALERFTTVVQSFHGRVLQYTGDGMLAAFGAEEVAEDDVEHAIRAGLAIIEDARSRAPEMRRLYGVEEFNVRAGVHTGTVLLGGGVDADGSIRGATVNVAARMEQSAPPGRLRISYDSYRHVKGLFEVTEQPLIALKGLEQPMRSFLVDRVKPRMFRVVNRGIEGVHTRMVGREAELGALCAAFEAVAASGSARAITIVGEAGIGKSRLLAEFQNTLSMQACWLLLARAHPRSALEPYGLLREMLSGQFQFSERDPAADARQKLTDGLARLFPDEGEAPIHLLGHLIGLDFSASPHVEALLGDEKQFTEQAFAAGALCLRRLGQSRPVVMVLDDLHWADAGSIDFLRHVLRGSQDMPLLTLVLTRATLFEQHADWCEGQAHHTRLDLALLDKSFSQELAQVLLQRMEEVPEALRALLTGNAEGNPFYMEELVKMLIDDGVIVVEADSWHISPDKLLSAHVPATLLGVLQARLDALAPDERLALQQAAVVGHEFWDQALAAVSPKAVDALPALLRKQLIARHDTASNADTGEYAFHHNLLHQVAYDSVLKGPRQAAHARAGQFWSLRAEVASPRDVTPASCQALAEASYHRCKSDATAYANWFDNQFSNYLDAYAAQALRPLAEQLIGICESQFGPDHLETARSLTNLARVILMQRGVERAEPLLRRAIDIQERSLGVEHPDTARTLAVLGGCYEGRGDMLTAEPYYKRALDIRERVLGAEHPLTLGTLGNLAKVTLELGRLDEAERLTRRVLAADERNFGPDHPNTAFTLTALAEVLAKKGDFANAEPMIRRALAVQQKHLPPDHPDTGLSMWHLAETLRGLGRCDEAEPLARRSLEMWENQFGPDHEWTGWGLISLAEVRLAQGDAAEAARLADRAAQIVQRVFGPENATLASTLCLHGRALCALSEHAAAVHVLERALAIQTRHVPAGDAATEATGTLLAAARTAGASLCGAGVPMPVPS